MRRCGAADNTLIANWLSGRLLFPLPFRHLPGQWPRAAKNAHLGRAIQVLIRPRQWPSGEALGKYPGHHIYKPRCIACPTGYRRQATGHGHRLREKKRASHAAVALGKPPWPRQVPGDQGLRGCLHLRPISNPNRKQLLTSADPQSLLTGTLHAGGLEGAAAATELPVDGFSWPFVSGL